MILTRVALMMCSLNTSTDTFKAAVIDDQTLTFTNNLENVQNINRNNKQLIKPWA